MPLIDNRKIIKNEIDYDKLAAAIVKATQAQEEADNQQREEALKELRKKYKVKEDISGKGLRVFAQKAFNNLRWFRAFLGYNSKQATSPVMTFELMRTISSSIFGTIQFALIVTGYTLIFFPTIAAFLGLDWFDNILSALLGFVSVLFSNFFRIAYLEVELMTNKELVNIVFSSLMAFIAALFTVLTFIRG